MAREATGLSLAPRSAPVVVVGMHRSGTSLVTNILHRHGLSLGDEADLLETTPDNPAGFFENKRFVQVNDALLAAFGGSLFDPPALPEGWVDDPRVASLAREAAETVAAFSSRPWGFKDPRTSLTLPFWQRICPGLCVVVCLRNPVEVAQSLAHRDGIVFDRAVALWAGHYRSILEHTTTEERVVVDYENLCEDPVEVGRDLLARLPVSLASADPGAIQAAVRRPLHHHRATAADLELRGAPRAVVAMYAKLLAEAGARASMTGPAPDPTDPVLREVQALAPALAWWDLALRDVQVEIGEVRRSVARMEAELRDSLNILVSYAESTGRGVKLLGNHFETVSGRLTELEDDVDVASTLASLALSAPERDSAAALGNSLLVHRVRRAMMRAIPEGAVIAVVSGGDQGLLDLPRRTVRHFPADASADHPGYRPETSRGAVAHLAQARVNGAEFLVVPRRSYWWLTDYPEFAQALQENATVKFENHACRVYALAVQTGVADRGNGAATPALTTAKAEAMQLQSTRPARATQ